MRIQHDVQAWARLKATPSIVLFKGDLYGGWTSTSSGW